MPSKTKEERVNQVYAIKIKIKNDGNIKIGMPGEVYFDKAEEETDKWYSIYKRRRSKTGFKEYSVPEANQMIDDYFEWLGKLSRY